jgi:hypothetical protein
MPVFHCPPLICPFSWSSCDWPCCWSCCPHQLFTYPLVTYSDCCWGWASLVVQPVSQRTAAMGCHTHKLDSCNLPTSFAGNDACVANQLGSFCCALGNCKALPPCLSKLSAVNDYPGAVLQLVSKNLGQPLCK